MIDDDDNDDDDAAHRTRAPVNASYVCLHTKNFIIIIIMFV